MSDLALWQKPLYQQKTPKSKATTQNANNNYIGNNRLLRWCTEKWSAYLAHVYP